MDSSPSIASLRPGTVAVTSDQLIPGDRIHSVNGINTSKMRPEDVSTLLDNVDGNAILEIEYSLPPYGTAHFGSVENLLNDAAFSFRELVVRVFENRRRHR